MKKPETRSATAIQGRADEKSRYQRSAEEEHHIERETHDDIEPEHRVVVAVGGMFQVDQSLRESAALQVAGNECKDGEYADDSIVGRREQACQKMPNKMLSTCVEPLFIAPQNNPLAVFSFNVSAIFLLYFLQN